MPSTKIITLLALSGIFVFVGAICGGDNGGDGGVFKSIDGGILWEQKIFVGQQGRKVKTIGSVDVFTLVQDPVNPQNIFMGSEVNGAFFTGNGGDQWGQITQVNGGKVRVIVFDPVTPTTIYITKDTQLIKTTDAGTTWDVVYTDTTGASIGSLVINPADPNLLYVGLSNGKIIRSGDGGFNWSVVLSESKKPISKLLINSLDPAVIYALEFEQEFWRSQDAGTSWERLNVKEHIQANGGSGALLRLFMDSANQNTMYLTTDNKGLMRTDDGGDTWNEVATLIGKSGSAISAFAIDPTNANILYMGINRFIHISYDRGSTWTVIENFPSNRQITALLVDAQNAQTVYAGTKGVEEKGGLIGPR